MNLFFRLIHIAVGSEAADGCPQPTAEEWCEALQWANEHTLTAFLLPAVDAIRRKAKDATPMVIMEWMGIAFQTEQQNKLLNQRVADLYRLFNHFGAKSCVLKGQGLARLYPQPLQRQCGDIDLWVQGSRGDTLRLLRRNYLNVGSVVIHHVDASIFTDVETEIHFMPIWLYCPWHNRRLQRFFRKEADTQFAHYDQEAGFCYPTGAFNAVYVLVHIFHHLLEEGIGLRQVVDYYFVLTHLSEEERETAKETLRRIGLKGFAQAMMYVLKRVCGLDEQYFLFAADKEVGRFVLSEIMQTGNFGQYDRRYQKNGKESAIGRNRRKWKRQWLFLRYYPAEVMCLPVWKLWHWAWRKFHGYK